MLFYAIRLALEMHVNIVTGTNILLEVIEYQGFTRGRLVDVCINKWREKREIYKYINCEWVITFFWEMVFL